MESTKEYNHFRSLHDNWIASLLHNPAYAPIPTDSRSPKPSGEDHYFASTLANASAIPHVLTLRRRTLTDPSPSPEPATWPAPTAKPSSEPSVTPPDVIVLTDLRVPGVCGHPQIAHGGVIATLLDEAMSLAVSVHAGTAPALPLSRHEQEQAQAQVQAQQVRAHGQDEKNPRGKIYTVQLDLRYKRPLLLPTVAVVRARVVARQGRKYWVRAQIVQEETDESQGQLEWPKRKIVTTDAMAFWLQTKDRDSHL